MDEILKYVLPGLGSFALVAVILLFFPEKIEKWSAILWKLLSMLGGVFRAAHKRYVKHDLQGRVNDFVRRLRKQAPEVIGTKLRIEWVDPLTPRESFVQGGEVVLRLRREDPQDHNFVHASYLFVSSMLLRKPKRYLAPSQREAIDLYVCTKLLESEKPAVVGVFLDEYLHPKTEEAKSKVAVYVDDLAIIDTGGLFFPVLIQELGYLGEKVFGKRRDDRIIVEVNGLLEFLKPIARRKVGDENELNFDGEYCRFGIVIVGKPKTLLTSVEPYVGYIRKVLVRNGAETIYILARAENEFRVQEICRKFEAEYDCSRRVNFRRLLQYRDRKELALQHLVVLRKRGVSIIHPSEEKRGTVSTQERANPPFQRTGRRSARR